MYELDEIVSSVGLGLFAWVNFFFSYSYKKDHPFPAGSGLFGKEPNPELSFSDKGEVSGGFCGWLSDKGEKDKTQSMFSLCSSLFTTDEQLRHNARAQGLSTFFLKGVYIPSSLEFNSMMLFSKGCRFHWYCQFSEAATLSRPWLRFSTLVSERKRYSRLSIENIFWGRK